jgi:hypothetical protein
MTVVGRPPPFHCTTELPTKSEPNTVKVNAGSPGVALVGERENIVGTGLVPLVIVKFTAFDVPPPGAGLITVTATMPTEAIAAAGMAAVNWMELANVVARAVPPKLTTEPETKFPPLTISVKAAPPAAALVGEIVVIVGTGLPPPPVEAVPLPHPARSKTPTIARMTKPAICFWLLFIFHLSAACPHT